MITYTMEQTTCAAFTMARNETLQLRTWLSYYSEELGEENCFVIHEQIDPTIDEVKITFPLVNFIVNPSPKPGTQGSNFYDNALEVWRLSVVKAQQAELLRRYDCCIFGDTDEILMPETSLLDYCKDVFIPSGADRIRSMCWQPVQQRSEPAVSRAPGSKVLQDRSVMWLLPTYDKTSLVRTPQTYSKGFHLTYDCHGSKRVDDPVDASLPLIHMWRVDVDDWLEDGTWRYGATRETALDYFETHKAAWVDPRPNWNPHAVGNPVPIPDDWKRRVVLR